MSCRLVHTGGLPAFLPIGSSGSSRDHCASVRSPRATTHDHHRSRSTFATDPSAGPDPGARELGSSSVLRYDRVDFSTVRDTLAVARLAGPSGGGARIELRLDSPARPPLAQIIPSADGSVNDISVPITPVVGVHRLYVTAHCPTTTDRCIELFAFGAAPSLSGALLAPQRP
ncbi:carbohydrate-binding protein [Streptomyces sp. NBC_01410]|uniref:carbohydrate-binding protein n=1 Tax=Streptomyces sp. NBC_01410 TaxID=2903856 RepID=UPI00324A4067